MKKFLTILPLSALSILLSGVPSEADGIGLVAGLRGEATVRRDRAAQAQRLKFKDDLFWQDTLSTGADTSLRLLILQKSVITMKELSQLQLREELVSPTQPRKKSVVNLISGAVRVVVEKDALKESDYEVHTNMAVAAIRGSDLFGQKTGDDQVEFCSGPESSIATTHRDPTVGTRQLGNLQCASFLPGGVSTRTITLDQYRALTNLGPLGGPSLNNPATGAAPPSSASLPSTTPGGGSGGYLNVQGPTKTPQLPPPAKQISNPPNPG
jgi:hypothetical protein